MTDAIDMNPSGEARLKSRRNRLWRFCGIGFAVSVAVGFATGFAADLFEAGTLPGWIFFIAWGLAMASFAWFTWEFFRRVDELDRMDNLWAGTVALYFYLAALPSWWLFHDIGLVPETNHYVIYAATALVFFSAYGLRKLGLR